MACPTRIQHPLLRRSGSSQRRRSADAFALEPDYAPIDNQSLEDLLDYVRRLARQVVFHEHALDKAGASYVLADHWLPFFEESLPFRLARFAAMDVRGLERSLLEIQHAILQNPRSRGLSALVDFCFFELACPIDDLFCLVVKHEFNALASELKKLIGASLLAPLRRYLVLSNTAATYLRDAADSDSQARKRRLTRFAREPWNVPLEDVLAYDGRIVHAPGGRDGAVLWLNRELVETGLAILKGLGSIAAAVEKYDETGSADFAADDFGDACAFALRLKFPVDAVSNYLRERLSESTLRELEAWPPSAKLPQELRESLVEDLNAITRGVLLWDSTRFKDVAIQERTRGLLAIGPTGNALVRLNKFLLEDAYPKELPRSPETSLEILKAGHEPHLGLLFAFLRLFRHLQDDLNQLTRKHLDFFYKQVLKIKPRGLVPDKAHLVLEMSTHRTSYEVAKHTEFKNGKDAKKADIVFRLDDSIVIDAAQVKDLKTLFLNPTLGSIASQGADPTPLLEGIYVAPIANSADGNGAPFQENQSKNWAALGASVGKYIAPGKDTPEPHPFGRIGFILASPVLWLNEGRREIKIKIKCDASGNPDVDAECYRKELTALSSRKTYFLTEQTIAGIENLFSPKAKTFLRQQLDDQGVTRKDILTSREGGVISEAEANILEARLEDVTESGEHKLKEMPFAPLVRHFNLLRLHQDPYKIGSNPEAFLASEDPLTCKPLLKQGLRRYIIPLFETDEESSNWFKIQFSGEKGWFEPRRKPALCSPSDTAYPAALSQTDGLGTPHVSVCPGADNALDLTLHVVLAADEPKVAFYDETAIGERFEVEGGYPMVKIELNPEVRLACQNHRQVGECCLGKEGGSRFSVAEFADFPSIARKLRQPSRAFDTWLVEQLAPATRAALEHYQGQGSDWAQLQQALLQDVNRILGGPTIHEQTRFEGITLRSETQTLISQSPQGRALERLNRLLIEDAYPLEVSRKPKEVAVALYQFFRHLTVTNATIDVTVCGLKHLVVQNEESLQDVNKPILAFGARPRLGAAFYVGSKELFAKNWQTFWLDIDWKDFPAEGLEKYYKDYQLRDFDSDPAKITNDSFGFRAAVLERGRWREDPTAAPVFADSRNSYATTPCDKTQKADSAFYKEFKRENFALPEYRANTLTPGDLKPLDVHSADFFFRMTLDGIDFQHDRYAFVLARKLFELSDALGPNAINSLKQTLDAANVKLNGVSDKISRGIEDIDVKIKEIQLKLQELLDKTEDGRKIIENRGATTDAIEAFKLRLQSIGDDLRRIAAILRDKKSLKSDIESALADLDKQHSELDAEIVQIDGFVAQFKSSVQDQIDVVKRIGRLVDEVRSALYSIGGYDGVGSSTFSEADLTEAGSAIASRLKNLEDEVSRYVAEELSEETRSALGTWHPPEKPSITLQKALVADLNRIISENTQLWKKAVFTDIPRRAEAKTVLRMIDEEDKTKKPPTLEARRRLNKLVLEDAFPKQLSKTPVPLLEGLRQELGNMARMLEKVKGGIPHEPYTPTIRAIEMDYRATADIREIQLIHLYPFCHTSKRVHFDLTGARQATSRPTLVPTLTDEGTLFIGLEKVRPGATVHLLFQFAEATADSEERSPDIRWDFLTANRWQSLRAGFEIVSDTTRGMTRSGIVKITLPREISNVGNTVMPPTKEREHLYWLRVSARSAASGVAELVDVHAQAALATYQAVPEAASDRVGKALPPNSLNKPIQPDFNIKKVAQPYESFGGRLPEIKGHFHVRVSEHLRHKGRGVDAFDMERLVLEAFPMLFKCKCITHTLGLSAHRYRRDLEVAPGFVVVAVIPDLRQLKAGDRLEPRAPAVLLDDVQTYLEERSSVFARIRVMNPRYEKLRVEAKVRLRKGYDEQHYSARLKTDLTQFLAPWHLGDSDKLSFGRHVVYSDVITLLENLDYVDVVTDLSLIDSEGIRRREVVPLTARSIPTGGRICITIDKSVNQPAPGSQ